MIMERIITILFLLINFTEAITFLSRMSFCVCMCKNRMRSELLFVRASFVSFSELLMTSILIIVVKKLLFSLLCHLLQTPKQIKLKYCNRFALVLWLFACVSCFSVRKKTEVGTDFRVRGKTRQSFQHRNKNRIRHCI